MADVKEVKTIDAIATKKINTNVIYAGQYENLPKASEGSAGIIKIDGATIKINEKGEIYVNVKVNLIDDISEHISNVDIHLSQEQKEALIDHIANNSIHFVGNEKEVVKKDISDFKQHMIDNSKHLNQTHADAIQSMLNHIENLDIHLTEDMVMFIVNNMLTDYKDHISNMNIHLSSEQWSSLMSSMDEVLSHMSNKNIHVTSDDKEALNEVVQHLLNHDIHITKELKVSIVDHIENENIHLTTEEKSAIIQAINDILALKIHEKNKDIHVSPGEIEEIKEAILSNIDRIQNLEDFKICIEEEVNKIISEKVSKFNHDKDKILITDGSGRVSYHQMSASDLLITEKGLEGQVPYYTNDNSVKTKPGMILHDGMFVETEIELEDAKQRKVDFSEVFSYWHRFSHGLTEAQPASQAELEAWVYDSTNNIVRCTVNSNTHIGFVSNIKYENYIHECTLKSTDNDDDAVGVVIAFAKDLNGREHTLTAIRTRNTDQPHVGIGSNVVQWAVVYNYRMNDAKIIDYKTISDDSVGAWSAIPNGVRIRVERNKDIIKAKTTSMNNPNIFIESSLISIDLNSDPSLLVFRGAASYGYSCLSQNSSSFSNILFIGSTDSVIYDLKKNEGWVYNGVTWVLDPNRDIYLDIGAGRILYDKYTNKIFFVKNKNSIINVFPGNSLGITKCTGGQTVNRPALKAGEYANYFDTTLNKPIWWNGAKWVDTNGNIV